MKKNTFFINIYNFYLKIRYILFKNCLKKVDFSDRNRLFYEDFKTLDNWHITDNEFYNDNPVWFSKDAIHLTDEGVQIDCYADYQQHTSWQKTDYADYTSGMITTRENFTMSNGVWVINAKPCDSWCAIWLLKRDRNEPGFNRAQITPEVDILEVLDKKEMYKYNLHYGYSDTVYKTKWMGSKGIMRNDNQFHEFAVESLTNGYKFYLDGILTAKFWTDDPEFVTDCPNYILLNNSSDNNTKKDTSFVIKDVTAYE